MSTLERAPQNALTAAAGYQAGGLAAGIKESGLPDLALLLSDRPAAAAAVFTRNVVKAAPLIVDAEQLREPSLRVVVVNSGNANCATGARGLRDARRMIDLAAERTGALPAEVFVNSTGIIGHYLPMERLAEGIGRIELRRDGGSDFARAIMTTDTFLKEAVTTFRIGARRYTLGGCAKGAGMIHPNMATMLAFLSTDAPVEPDLLQGCLVEAVERSFNMISVDGDTSTNDTVLLLANGAGGGPALTPGDPRGTAALQDALIEVCGSLARDVARDGEGATRLIEIKVTSAPTRDAAAAIARSVSRSILLKAALSKGDPNWGRVLMAAGNAGVAFDPATVRLWLGGRLLYAQGESAGVAAAEATDAVQDDTVQIHLDLAGGEAEATAWGCDLTEEYVRFNADYVT